MAFRGRPTMDEREHISYEFSSLENPVVPNRGTLLLEVVLQTEDWETPYDVTGSVLDKFNTALARSQTKDPRLEIYSRFVRLPIDVARPYVMLIQQFLDPERFGIESSEALTQESRLRELVEEGSAIIRHMGGVNLFYIFPEDRDTEIFQVPEWDDSRYRPRKPVPVSNLPDNTIKHVRNRVLAGSSHDDYTFNPDGTRRSGSGLFEDGYELEVGVDEQLYLGLGLK